MRPFNTRTSLLLALSLAASLVWGCGGGRLRQLVRQATPWEQYEESLRQAKLESTGLGRDWIAAGARALSSAVPVTLPFRETGYFRADEANAVGYRFELKRGQRFDVAFAIDGGDLRLFVDLFRLSDGEAPQAAASARADERRLAFEADRDGVYVLRVQPELLRGGRFTVTQRAEASLRFPVPTVRPSSVAATFGLARDGGRRSHEGLDIFAPRGTMVVAAVDGVIEHVGTNTLGGNVVWLRDSRRGLSFYYAHLDQAVAKTGQKVVEGDPIGRVGNTGNARTTPPHLHFGIYAGWPGAIDPRPFLVSDGRPLAPVTASTASLGGWRRVARRHALLRTVGDRERPSTLPPYTIVRIDGVSGNSYRVRLPDSSVGFIAASQTEAADKPVRRMHPGDQSRRARPAGRRRERRRTPACCGRRCRARSFW